MINNCNQWKKNIVDIGISRLECNFLFYFRKLGISLNMRPWQRTNFATDCVWVQTENTLKHLKHQRGNSNIILNTLFRGQPIYVVNKKKYIYMWYGLYLTISQIKKHICDILLWKSSWDHRNRHYVTNFTTYNTLTWSYGTGVVFRVHRAALRGP